MKASRYPDQLPSTSCKSEISGFKKDILNISDRFKRSLQSPSIFF